MLKEVAERAATARALVGGAFVGAALLGSAPAFAQAPTPSSSAPAAPATPAPTAAPAAPAAPTVTLLAPGMAGTLAFTPGAFSTDVGPLGKWYINGVLSGLGLVQSNAVASDKTGLADISNGQIFIQKVDGLVQFYAQIGAYSIPVLGTPYSHLTDAENALGNFFSAVPQAFIKLQPTDTFSIEAGKLPTLIGAEYTFDFENFNIERGLLWNQEPAVSRGVQANYTVGPVALSVSLNDGYYSNRYNWISGSATWTVNPTNTLVFAAGGNFSSSGTASDATPLAQNNSSIYNIIYTYNNAPLTITPYVQFQHIDANQSIGIAKSTNAYSGAVLANYVFTPNWQLSGRAEYIHTDGSTNDPLATNLLYGPGSGAFSFTVTPTYTLNHFFVRAEASVVDITDLTSGDGFGSSGHSSTQVRGLLEGGVIF